MNIFRKLRSLFRRKKLDAEMTEEMRRHVELQTELKITDGVDPEEAHYAALREFGNITCIQEQCRERRGWLWLENLWRDLRFSFRSLRRSPGFSAAVIVTLALCIGANTTIMSVLYGLILKPLPFRDSGQLVEIYNSYTKTGRPKMATSVAQYLDYKSHADLFDGFALWRVWTFNIGEESDPVRGIGARVTADYFGLLGVQPLLGRFYTMEECVPGKDHVVVLTQTCWETRYQADPAIIGRVIRLGGEQFTIIGVAPRNIEVFNTDAIMLKPFEWTPQQADMQARYALNPRMYARAKTGVALSAALAQLTTLEKQFYAQVASPSLRNFVDQSGHAIALGQIRIEQTKSVTTGLLLLQAAALFVLLLGCVNVANLMLARANARQAELAIRQALGAGRGILARQMFTEGFLLAASGAIIGVGMTWGSLRIINTYIADIVREAPPIALDVSILGLTVFVSFAVALLIGLLPVVRLWRSNLLALMHGGARSASGAARVRTASGLLVTIQVALALILLVGASLLIRSFSRIAVVDPGFDATRILHARVALNASYNEASTRVFFDQIRQKMQELPGVEAVGISSHIPINGQTSVGAFPIRGSSQGKGENFPTAAVMGASPDYFSTMRIRIMEGRSFTQADMLPGARQVLIVDRQFAAKYFPGRSAVGEGFVANGPNPKADDWPLIIGVADGVKYNGPEDRSELPMIYAPISAFGGFSIEVRTARPMADLVPQMRAALRSLDPTLPLYSIGTLQMAVEGTLANRKGVMGLLSAFAGIALILSAVGIYGMLAYDVTQRTKEIGIRGAIGATRTQIVTLILKQGLWKTGMGLIIGLGGALYLSRYMRSLLFEVAPNDPVTFAGVSLLLLFVAALASWLPARRAAKVDPVVALRAE